MASNPLDGTPATVIRTNGAPSTFVFRRHDHVGSAAAEEDVQYLDTCFVDTGDLRFLLDCSSPRRIIVGRTGSGKSALIHQLLRTNRHAVLLSPHDLSLNFIATNKVIAFFEAAGVNLAPFYVLLWKHLLVVELLKAKFGIVNEESHTEFMRRVRGLFNRTDKYKATALEYLEQWGNKFWLTTEQRIHELTERVQTSLKGDLDATSFGVPFTAEAGRTLSKEQKQQIVEHGLDAVSRVQIRELDNMIAILEEDVFDDEKDPYYIAIDMLDEDWADDRIKFKLIRALIDTVRRFKNVPNVKVILALRQDLLDKVLSFETVAGFQEEKYKALYLDLRWTKEDLIALVQRRINQLIRRRYTKGDVTFLDLFPSKVDTKDTFDYLLERTFGRPRDVILFVNECLSLADGRPSLTAAIIKQAEERYSAERLQSLANEWYNLLPNLLTSARLFQGLRDHFAVSDVTEPFLVDRHTELLTDIADADIDPITRSLNTLCTERGNFTSIRNFVLREFYLTGLIGIKSGPTDSINWARQTGRARLSPGDIRPSSSVHIHPMFHRALGIRYSR